MKLLGFKTPEKDFVEYIIDQYITRLLLEFDTAKNKKLNDFLLQIGLDKNKILKSVVDNITYIQYNDLFYVVIPDNIQIDGFNLVGLCKLIEAGTIDIPPYPIFQKTSKYIESRLQSYMYKYDLRGY